MRPIHQAGVVLLVAVSCGAKKKKTQDVEPVGPIVGWHQDEGAVGACYHPPDFEQLGLLDRRAARDQALQAMKGQWQGERGDGVVFEGTTPEDVETVLLGYPEKIEKVAVDNLAWCQKAMAGGGTDAWGSWLTNLPRELTRNECLRPLDATMFWYLDLKMGWQGAASICDDNVVKITASSIDMYRVAKKAPWINAEGDRSQPALGDYPCNHEGCYVGEVIMRFRGQSGVELIKPVGTELVFDPPEHGTIEFMANDLTYDDNEFKVEQGMQHHTAVSYVPVEAGEATGSP